jgi:type I restriction enzyme M protein
MLDSETKRRIDSCRDILVGKVPDPKSQVEQITIALIYKFMDDMDAEAEELGGKRSFFAGEYAKYGWAKLMSPSRGGFDVLALYSEAIAKMNENPAIPALFRDIFKNAYLPYRDPETLRSFLKEINVFTYDHSERLGDAFEYLLSVLGSQGDAGQFRTPRHIIDFMVEIINPQKNESILDPACGTAGFLISAWKYILKQNTTPSPSPTGGGAGGGGVSVRMGDKLTREQRKHLAANIHGYDISPDMVRLSLVNLYLHGFTDPHIVEYDTLTSEDKWNETADVILANPPFMSPKGGIKPHKRFSIQAKRSEVLFVDYMAEHLSSNGRAAIIVPEGIIFQSQGAYTQLRKMLVENSLVAVISLPAGCFNPYSGVKTSILILDKSLAKKAQTIAFFKVANDGFGLGAQRRAIAKTDLPQVQAELETYLHAIRSGQPLEPSPPGGGQGGGLQLSCGLIVAKEKIAANGDYNLSGERYRENGARSSTYHLRRFDEVCTLEYGSSLPKDARIAGPFPVVGSNGITGYHNEFIVDGPAIVVGRKGSAGEVTLIETPCFPIDTTYYVKQTKPEESDLRYLYWILKGLNLPELRGGAGIPGLNRTDVYETHKIPLPPLKVQKEIVAEIEGYQKVINGARAVLDHYRPHIHIHPDWPMVEVGQVFRKSEKTIMPESLSGAVNYIGLENISQGTGEIVGAIVSANPAEIKSLKAVFGPNDVLYGKLRPNLNKVWLADREGICSTDILVIQPLADKVVAAFYAAIFRSAAFNEKVMAHIKGAQLPRVGWSSFASIDIPLPPLATQQQIVAEIEAEQALVAANRELIARFEKKIQATLARVWGEAA